MDDEKPSSTLLSMKVRPTSALVALCKPFIGSVLVAAFFAVGCLFYENFEEDWTLVDCIYFQMVTVSTVGYGDFSPSEGENQWIVRLFTVLWILVGILVVFTQLAKAVTFFVLPIVRVVRHCLDCLCPKGRSVDVDGDGEADVQIPRHPLIYYPIELVAPVAIAACVQLGAAAVFVHVEGWDYGTAFYHCMVTATTVGYGDVSIESQEGRVVATVHILLSVALIAMLISEVDGAAARRAKALEKLRLLRCKLDANLIVSLDKDGTGVDKLEFVIGMIVKLKMLEWADVEPFIKQFDALDTDGSGKLDKADLERAAELTAQKIGGEKARHFAARFDASHSRRSVSDLLATAVSVESAVGKMGLRKHTQVDPTATGQGRSVLTQSTTPSLEGGGGVQMAAAKAARALGKAKGKAKAPTGSGEVKPAWRVGDEYAQMDEMQSASV